MHEKVKKLIPQAKAAEVEHERLTRLINSMGDGVLAIDEKQKIVTYNGAALNILDLNSSINGKLLPSVLIVIDKNNIPHYQVLLARK